MFLYPEQHDSYLQRGQKKCFSAVDYFSYMQMWGTFISLISKHRCPFIQLTYFDIIIIIRCIILVILYIYWFLLVWIWINIYLLLCNTKSFRITCHKHQISHFEEYRNKSYDCSCNILYPWYPKRQENLIVIWMQMLLMVKNFLQSQIVTAKPYVSSEQILNILNRIHIKNMYNS